MIYQYIFESAKEANPITTNMKNLKSALLSIGTLLMFTFLALFFFHSPCHDLHTDIRVVMKESSELDQFVRYMDIILIQSFSFLTVGLLIKK